MSSHAYHPTQATPFVEEPPEITDRRLPKTAKPPTVADRYGYNTNARPIAPFGHQRGRTSKTSEVLALPRGAEIQLVPSNDTARLLLEAARAQLGTEWDSKLFQHIPRFDPLLRRSVSRADGVLLTCEALGVPISVPEQTVRYVARFRTRLARLLAPIPRTIWVDHASSIAVAASIEAGQTRDLHTSNGWWSGRR